MVGHLANFGHVFGFQNVAIFSLFTTVKYFWISSVFFGRGLFKNLSRQNHWSKCHKFVLFWIHKMFRFWHHFGKCSPPRDFWISLVFFGRGLFKKTRVCFWDLISGFWCSDLELRFPNLDIRFQDLDIKSGILGWFRRSPDLSQNTRNFNLTEARMPFPKSREFLRLLAFSPFHKFDEKHLIFRLFSWTGQSAICHFPAPFWPTFGIPILGCVLNNYTEIQILDPFCKIARSTRKPENRQFYCNFDKRKNR